MTIKHLPYAKIRVGKFKFPGSEEGLQAVFVSPYISFTNMSFQQLLERRIYNVGTKQTGAAAGGAKTAHYTSTSIDEPIGAFRDTGIQIFDTIPIVGNWAVTYAYMYGNGAGISNKNSGRDSTHYAYLAVEETHGGKGYFTECMKFFAWGQTGNRELLSNDGTTSTTLNFRRDRYGLGMTYYHYGIRFELEYMKAKGMIFTGSKDTDPDPLVNNWQFQYAVGFENEADGGYVNLQYEVLPRKLEVYGRYDILDRLPNDEKAQRVFTTTTVGLTYRFKGATRVDFNYAFRDAKAPGNPKAQKILDNMGDRIEVQVTAHF